MPQESLLRLRFSEESREETVCSENRVHSSICGGRGTPAEAGSSDVSPAVVPDQRILAVFVFTVTLIWGLQVCWFVFSFNFGDPEAVF